MLGRIGSHLATLAVALAALFPAIALAQVTPGMPPNMEELMRQAGAAQGGHSRSAAPAPPGVPVPADSPLIAAFRRLDSAKAYRVRMEMSTTARWCSAASLRRPTCRYRFTNALRFETSSGSSERIRS